MEWRAISYQVVPQNSSYRENLRQSFLFFNCLFWFLNRFSCLALLHAFKNNVYYSRNLTFWKQFPNTNAMEEALSEWLQWPQKCLSCTVWWWSESAPRHARHSFIRNLEKTDTFQTTSIFPRTTGIAFWQINLPHCLTEQSIHLTAEFNEIMRLWSLLKTPLFSSGEYKFQEALIACIVYSAIHPLLTPPIPLPLTFPQLTSQGKDFQGIFQTYWACTLVLKSCENMPPQPMVSIPLRPILFFLNTC